MTIILITGIPGVGKTTFIRKITDSLKELHPVGFYTQEIRERGERVGFELIGFDGSSRLLAHINIRNQYRVGKYGVDITGFEEYLKTIALTKGEISPIIIDEIGKMECFSPLFRDLITKLLESDCLIIATIAKKGDHFIETIKRRGDVTLYEVTRENRDLLPSQVLEDIATVQTSP